MENKNEIFTESDYEEMLKDGTMTAEEVELMKSATAIAGTMDLLPDDATEVLKKLEALTPSQTGEEVSRILSLVQTDEKFFVQLMTLAEIADSTDDGVTATNDPLITALSDEEYSNVEKNFFESFANMSYEKRKELIAMLNSLTDAQKADLINQLKK